MEDVWISTQDGAALFADTPLRLMPLDEIEADLEHIWRGCGTDLFPAPPPDDAEWARIIADLLPSTRQAFGTGTWLRAHSERERGALGYTANTLWHLVRHERSQQRELPPSRFVLLPHDWQARMRLCIGTGELPFAWIARMARA